MYGERKKVTEKVYPKGYADQLVADHARLVKCIHQLAETLIESGEWKFPEVQKKSDGKFLTHDILRSMDLLQPISIEQGEDEKFEDDPQRLLKKFESKQKEPIKSERVSPAPTYARQMSRDPSQESMAFLQYTGLENVPLSGYGLPQRPPGGHFPPTPDESPSKEGPQFDRSFGSGLQSTTNELKVTMLRAQSQSFAGPSSVSSVHAHAFDAVYGRSGYGQSQSPWPCSDATTYLQNEDSMPCMAEYGGPYTTLGATEAITIPDVQDGQPWLPDPLAPSTDTHMAYTMPLTTEDIGTEGRFEY